jgi:hypothetical protein
MHLVNSNVSLAAWLGMVEPPLKRFGAIAIVPEWMEMIKTEKLGLNQNSERTPHRFNTVGKWVLLVFEG